MKVAVVQMNSGEDKAQNLSTAERLLGEAAARGAELTVLPELYRRLGAAGARVITAPSAFTFETGKDHWDLLVRTRAVENQVFVLAAAQVGSHPPGLACYGNAMIVDPWGTVLARAPEEECVVVADLDFAHQDRIRASLPALSHRRTEILGL